MTNQDRLEILNARIRRINDHRDRSIFIPKESELLEALNIEAYWLEQELAKETRV